MWNGFNRVIDIETEQQTNLKMCTQMINDIGYKWFWMNHIMAKNQEKKKYSYEIELKENKNQIKIDDDIENGHKENL